jgi:hypothetical protein
MTYEPPVDRDVYKRNALAADICAAQVWQRYSDPGHDNAHKARGILAVRCHNDPQFVADVIAGAKVI